MQTRDVPLSRFAAVDTRSPNEAREAIGRIFCPHFLSPVERNPQTFHARHHTVEQSGYSVNFVSYGATVEIDPGELSRFFLLQIPLKGSARVRCGTVSADVGAGVAASLLSPTLPTRMTWQEGCEKLIILISRETLEAQFEALTRETSRAIEFQTGIDLNTFCGRALLQHAGTMLAAAEEGDTVAKPYQVLLRDGLSTLLLTGFASNRSEVFSPGSGGGTVCGRARRGIHPRQCGPGSCDGRHRRGCGRVAQVAAGYLQACPRSDSGRGASECSPQPLPRWPAEGKP